MLHRHASPAVAGSYLVGALTGALLTTSALVVGSGFLSPIPASIRGAIALTAIGLLALHAVGVVCLDVLPQRAYQIPRETFHATPTRAAFRFAFELGTGVRTYITATAPYCAALLLLLTLPQPLGASALSALTLALGYGLGRSLIVALQAVRSAVAVEHPQRWLRASDVLAVGLAGAITVQFLLEHA